MVRALSLAPLIFVAGCVMTPAPLPQPPQIPSIGEVRLALDDMEGVPDEVRELVYREIDQQAFSRGIAFDSHSVTVEIHGYLSVVAGGPGTLVIYVFDFEDRSGRRLFRVGGQATSLEAPADPWDAFDRELADRIVDELFEAFDQWVAENAVGA